MLQSFLDYIYYERDNSAKTHNNYLGFITGGGLSSENDTWTIQVNCTGFTELPDSEQCKVLMY